MRFGFDCRFLEAALIRVVTRACARGDPELAAAKLETW
jgi:hypothetical protein